MAYPSQSKVCFFFDQVHLTLQNKLGLKKFIEQLFRKEGKRLESLNYIFCSDEALLRINKNYLAHDYYTDIITFDLSEPGSGITGEIYISIDRVRDNAVTEETTIKSELHRVIFHGALHLCGYGDKTKAQVAEMRKREDSYMQRYFR